MDLFLQVWGGLCYLSNKILFAVSVDQQEALRRQLKIAGWIIYIIGVPAWVIILIGKHDWIAASIEAGGVPAMLLGLYNTIHNHQRINRLFNRLVALCTYSSLGVGVLVSLYHHGGLSSFSQVLEIGVMFGFLLGSYFLAKNNTHGWLFFMLMNVSMASLMFIQDKQILMVQQLLSLGFVIYGYWKSVGPLRGQSA